MVKWYLYLRHQSPQAYELLHSSGCIRLPSQCLLRDYTYHVTSSPGFSTEIDQQLMEDANIASLEDFQKHVCLLGDEMHIKEDLVYDKTSGELVGFVNLGNVNEHLIQLEQDLLQAKSASPALASSVFVFMVRGLSSFHMPPFLASHLVVTSWLLCSLKLSSVLSNVALG